MLLLHRLREVLTLAVADAFVLAVSAARLVQTLVNRPEQRFVGSDLFGRDPIESDPRFKEILADVDAAVEEELKHRVRLSGFCYTVWKTKKRILEERYGVKWKSPAELNPHIDFD